MKEAIHFRALHAQVIIVYVVKTWEDGTGHWSAYCVPLEEGMSQADNVDRWRKHGCKITVELACCVYPILARDLLKRGLDYWV